ncbi:MAG: amidohydrolase [Planctomycetes bacterium]|nr:amidohydrolase [Planctomycetota bacterium]
MPTLLDQANIHRDWLVKTRRELHQKPELSLKEKATAARCADELEKLGLKVKRNLWGEGFIADLDVKGAKGRIALRADMDALPIQELNEIDFRSQNAGVAHMCGHDTHMTCAMGAAKLLVAAKEKLKRNVRFIFQPSEETPPGGALGLIEKGALDGVDEVYGLHNNPQMEVGTVATRVGALTAAADSFKITLTGKGGHASRPHDTLDPIPGACALVTQLQTLVARRVAPGTPAVVSVTQITGGTTHNIIPDSVFMQGTVRTFDEATRKLLEDGMWAMSDAIAKGHGLKCRFAFERGYDSIVNHAAGVERVVAAAAKVVGEKNVSEHPAMTWGEDFAYYLQKKPGAFFFLGSGNKKKGITEPLHSPRMMVDEDCMPIGAAIMAQLALGTVPGA